MYSEGNKQKSNELSDWFEQTGTLIFILINDNAEPTVLLIKTIFM